MHGVLRSDWEAPPNTSSRTTFYATIVCASYWKQPQSVILTLEVRASMPLCSATVPVRQHYVFDRFAEQLVLVSYGQFLLLFECSNATGDSAVVMVDLVSYCSSKSLYLFSDWFLKRNLTNVRFFYIHWNCFRRKSGGYCPLAVAKLTSTHNAFEHWCADVYCRPGINCAQVVSPNARMHSTVAV